MARADFDTLIQDLVPDAAQLGDDARARALDMAVAQYGKDRPRKLVRDTVAGTGPLVDLPEGFDAGASEVLAIEHPVGQVPPALLTADQFQPYEAPDGMKLLFRCGLGIGTAVRVTFTAPHVLAAGEDTIPARDREAVASYAAAVLHDQLASATSGDASPTIQADNTNHQTKSGSYAKRAQALRQRYHDLLGIDEKRAVGASVLVANSLPASDGGRRMFNRRRGA